MKRHLLVPQQVPDFVRSEHPAFVEFLQAYYKWLEDEYSTGKLEDLVDLDDTVDGFVKYFRKQLDIYGITVANDDRLYLKNIKELYGSKGSFAGFEFLFKILYNKPSSVIQPWDYVFIPSNGEWRQDTSILTNLSTQDATALIGNPIIVTDIVGRQYRTFVNNINTRRDGINELFISRFVPQAKLLTIKSLDSTITGNVLQTTQKAIVEQPGRGFRIGQVFEVNSNSGSGSLIKVKDVDSVGAIRAVEIITFGTGYLADFNILIAPVNEVDPTTLGARIQLGEFTYSTNDNINPQNERGSIVQHNYTDLNTEYVVDPTYVGNTVAEIETQISIPNVASTDYATIRLNVGTLCVYPGYYASSNNIVGDLVYIQDSYYYQAFSYVTSLEEQLSSYSEILKQVLHPVGTKLFGEFKVDNEFGITVEVEPSLNLIAKADALRDLVDMVDIITFASIKMLDDGVLVEDIISIVASFITSFSDEVQLSDDTALQVAKGLTDNISPEDTLDRAGTFIRTFGDLALFSDTISSFQAAKGLADGILTGDNFSRAGTFIRELTDSISCSDNIASFQPIKALTDVVTLSDLIQIVPGIQLEETFGVSDNVSFGTDKYIDDTVQTANGVGGIYMEPYYVEPDPAAYWGGGYLENERSITN